MTSAGEDEKRGPDIAIPSRWHSTSRISCFQSLVSWGISDFASVFADQVYQR
jgi:hypothetical protein